MTSGESSTGADFRSVLGFQYATVRRWAQAVHKKLEPGDWLSRPAGFRNHPHWIYGHLAVSSDVAPGMVKVEPLVPKEWFALFDQGTRPDPEGMGYPAPGDLAALLEKTMDRNLETLGSVDPAELQRPMELELPPALRDFLRTRERWVSFSALHLSYHLGQINMIHRTLHPEAQGL